VQAWILLTIMIGALVVVGIGVVLFVLARNVRLAQGPATAGKYPQGHWMGIGMAIGLPIGYLPSLLIGILTDNTTDNTTVFIALGPAIGCALALPSVLPWSKDTRTRFAADRGRAQEPQVGSEHWFVAGVPGRARADRHIVDRIPINMLAQMN